MLPELDDGVVEAVARALGTAPRAAFWAPLEYPWSVQNFASTPRATRVRPTADRVDLYVHVPFCRYRCSFCIYAVRPVTTRAEMDRYVCALDRELQGAAPGASITKLIVGGGTPTALPPELLDDMFGRLLARVDMRPGGGHKLEASPDSLEDAHLEVLQKHGIGWVSVGVESLEDGVLGTVHRRHTPEQALTACRKVVERGLRLNADLIYGLPGQTEASFRRDLERLVEAGVHRVCLYALRVNEKVRAASQLAPEERFDLVRLMRWRSFVMRATRELGFEPTSYYAFRRADGAPAPAPREKTAGHASREVVGIGMSARSDLGGAVYRNSDRIESYMERVEGGASPVETTFALAPDDLKTQVVARTLGNGRALTRAAYHRRCASSIDADFGPVLERLSGGGLIDDDGERIVLTELGGLVYDRVVLCFYPERAHAWLKAWSQTPRVARLQPADGPN